MIRHLTTEEIAALESRGCVCDRWERVTVAEGFTPGHISNVEFSGDVRLGTLNGTFTMAGGLTRHSAITDVTLHNVNVGNDVLIRRVAGSISNYDIADGACIENADALVCTLDSTFGIGTEVSVLNETGGREVPIYGSMSAHTAYLIAMYRDRAPMVERLCTMIREKAGELRGRRGRVGKGARVINTGSITDVNIGDYATVSGATRLMNGTIASSQADPVRVGRDVIAEGFIFASGSCVDDGAVVRHCFIGQATHLSHLFSAHDSLFFANCTCENGEAAAIFGGPYTVTMHKSSLLIAGLFSFLNAGSGSNQSNHMYKLGPIHQGVVERGSKTTSDSYILWPARIGAFSLVMGRHVNHPDTSRLPFSYLIENNGGSFLVPGVNLRSVGTIRDAQKWPKRDKRRDPKHLDCINFNLLSPYTVGKMMGAIDLLDALEETAGLTAERLAFQSMTIEARALRRGRDYYRLAIDKFMGNSLINRLGTEACTDVDDMRRRLECTCAAGRGQWVDICGLIAPKSEVDSICSDIEQQRISDLDTLEKRWHDLHAAYYDMEWTWAAEHFEKWYGKSIGKLMPSDVKEIIECWEHSVTTLNRLLLEDAAKEYSLRSRTGFGIDAPDSTADSDFISVRGSFDADPFVAMVRNHSEVKHRLGQQAISLLPD